MIVKSCQLMTGGNKGTQEKVTESPILKQNQNKGKTGQSGSKRMYALFLVAESRSIAGIWNSKQVLPLTILK